MQKTLIIDDHKIKSGERKRFEIKVAKLFDHTDMTLPVEVIRGMEPGPTIFLSAAIHGDEINGVEVIKRILARHKMLSRIKGTIIAVPIVNVFGFNRNIRYLPDRRDLNRSFPGAKDGSLASRIAYRFMKEIVEKCDYGFDIHTGSAHRFNIPQIRTYLDNPETEQLAKACRVPVVIHSNIRDGSLRQAASEKGVNTLLFEGGEALRYDEKIIRSAEKAIYYVLEEIGILEKKATKSSKTKDVFIASASHWIRAPHSGSLRKRKNIGNHVKKGEVLGVISDPFGVEKYYVKAKRTGVIIGITMLPLVNDGDALFHVATFNDEADTEAVADEVMRHDERL